MVEPRERRGLPAFVASSVGSIALVCGCVYVALTPPDVWSWQTTWAIGLLLLPVIELVRQIPLVMMQGALEEANDPLEARRLFLRKMAIVILLALVATPGLFIFAGFGACVGIALLVFDDSNKLQALHGDTGVEIARLQTVSDDLMAWYRLSLIIMPVTFVSLAALLNWLVSKGITPPALAPSADFLAEHPDYAVPDVIPNLDLLHCAALLNVAFYFAGKAVILSYLDSSRFAATGRSLLWRLHKRLPSTPPP